MTPSGVIRDLQRSVAGASEGKMAQIVKMVDAMAERGSADDLIAPLRRGQGHLMPARPLRLPRLLFLPLDPIVVQPAQWRLGAVSIPRSAIPPVASAIQTALGGAEAIEKLIAGHHVGDTEIQRSAGAVLWSAAARIVPDLAECPGWEAATGLPKEAWLEIRTTIAGVMRIAGRIWGEKPPGLATRAAILGLIDEVQTCVPKSINAVISVILALSKNPEPIMMAVSQHSDQLTALSVQAVSRVLNALPDVLKNDIGRACLSEAADKADGIDTFIRSAELSGLASPARIKAAKLEAGAECVLRFSRGMASELFPPGRPGHGSPSDAAVKAMETLARSLHRIECAGRSFGVMNGFKQPLDEAWTHLTTGADDLDMADRARIGEILFGPDKAESLVDLAAP